MKKVFLFILITIFISSCATVSYKRYPQRVSYPKGGFLDLKQFCRKNKLSYKFDTLDDIVRVYSDNIDLRFLLDSTLVYFNGKIYDNGEKTLYKEGRIFIPQGVERLIKSPPPSLVAPSFSFNIRTIVIDPGHGGKDPGAISKRGIKEKHINLQVAKYLQRELKKAGYRVYLTRDRDIYLSLKERVELGRRYGADLFISVHSNSSRSRRLNGVEVYYLADRYVNNEARAVALIENASFSNDIKRLSLNAKRILGDMLIQDNHTRSRQLAKYLTYVFKRMGLKTKSPQGAPFYVLKYAYTPSVLVEIGYLSNPYEEKLLTKNFYQRQIAEGITLGVKLLDKHYRRVVAKASF